MQQISFCVIDDEKDVLDGLCDNLRSLGPVKGFTSAQLALEAFEKGLAPAVTIVDLKMPAISGLDFIGKCQERNVGGAMILTSGNAGKVDLANAINLGASRFLEKPFTALELRKTVISVLQNAPDNTEPSGLDTIQKWSQLCDVYYELFLLVENCALSSGQPFLPNTEDKARYLDLKVRERILRQTIDFLASTL